MPPLSDLIRARQLLAAGVGKTTRENRVLPSPGILSQIPQRIGAAGPKRRRSVGARGFVAVVHGSPLGVRFNPYTLAILDPRYELAGAGYGTAGTKTTWNVPGGDTTNWHDTLCFWDSKIFVNAAEMSLLQLPVAPLSFSAVAYLIPSLTNPGEPYGNAGENATAKRVFAIGRDRVKSWAFGGTEQVLTPEAPRTDNKAMTIGQRTWTDSASFAARTGSTVDKAWLGQMYFTGATWDAVGGGWAFSAAEVTLMLTTPYLTKINSTATVDLTTATLGAAVPTSGAVNDPVTLPATPIGMYGTGVPSGPDPFPNRYSYFTSWCAWPWAGTVDRALTGKEAGTFTAETRTGAASASPVQAGRTLNYAANNTKTWKSRSYNLQLDTQTTVYTTDSGGVGRDIQLYWNPGFVWSHLPSGSTKGKKTRYIENSTISGSSVVGTEETQTINASVSTVAVVLIDLHATQTKTGGQKASAVPNTTYYQPYLSNPWGLVGSNSGMGIYSYTGLRPEGIPTNPPDPSAPTPASVVAAFGAMTATLSAMTMYDDETSSGVSHSFYSGLVANNTTVNANLNWTTRDYLLYDETNGVFISIVGQYTGSQSAPGNATATLSVKLWIHTRHHLLIKDLADFNYSPGTLLIEQALGGGKFAVPSPQIRAIFAPLYQEQGAWKGAHYVTEAEELAGATPAHLFNFALRLRTYDAFGTVNADNEAYAAVTFVPCNLLEMCYATVFSDEFGVGPTRYPVNYTTRFNDMVAALFTNDIAIAVRDGTETAWTPTINAAGASLYRT